MGYNIKNNAIRWSSRFLQRFSDENDDTIYLIGSGLGNLSYYKRLFNIGV